MAARYAARASFMVLMKFSNCPDSSDSARASSIFWVMRAAAVACSLR